MKTGVSYEHLFGDCENGGPTTNSGPQAGASTPVVPRGLVTRCKGAHDLMGTISPRLEPFYSNPDIRCGGVI